MNIRLCGLENGSRRVHIMKIQAMSRHFITYYMYSSLVYTITNALEEKDREEFTRLKVIKRMKMKNS